VREFELTASFGVGTPKGSVERQMKLWRLSCVTRPTGWRHPALLHVTKPCGHAGDLTEMSRT
jgi:hypothetical protein